MKIYELTRGRYDDRDAFIDMVKGQLALHDLTQADLARRSGYKPSVISRWFTSNEKVRVSPSYEAMLNLDEALDQLIGEV